MLESEGVYEVVMASQMCNKLKKHCFSAINSVFRLKNIVYHEKICLSSEKT